MGNTIAVAGKLMEDDAILALGIFPGIKEIALLGIKALLAAFVLFDQVRA